MKIKWNGFLEHAIKEYPKEACGFLFSKLPYHTKERWYVFPVINASNAPEVEWIPHKQDMIKVKSKATKMGLVKIGNVHTHPYHRDLGKYDEDKMQEIIKPSDRDLKFARKFNDVVRIIICMDDKAIYDCFIHDKFGNKIDGVLDGID